MSSLIQIIPLSTVATANFTSASLDTFILPVTFKRRSIGLQVISSSLSTSDANIKIQESNDDVNYTDIPSATITLLTGSTVNTLFTDLRLRYIRLVFTKNTNAAGTLSGIANLI